MIIQNQSIIMNKNPLKIPCIILSVFSLLFITSTAVLFHLNSGLKDQLNQSGVYLEDAKREIDELRNAAEEAQTEKSVGEEEIKYDSHHHYIDENTVYIYDNGIDVIEYPSIEGASLNNYNMSFLKTDEKKHKVLYDNDGNKRSRFGIDVSSYQTNIDWQAVKDDGVEFAIVRIGYRGYETGRLCEDKYFRKNLEEASLAGIDTGVYFFSQALNEAEAIEEAEYVIDLIEETGAKLSMPVIFDWEFPSDEDPARTESVSGEIQTVCCRAFCDRIIEAGYNTMYYSTINTAIFRYDMGSLSDIPLWIAEYSAECDFVYDYRMWQYSCSGIVNGIEGFVDFNLWISDL